MEVINIIIIFSLYIKSEVEWNDRVYSIKYSSNSFVVDKWNNSRVFYFKIREIHVILLTEWHVISKDQRHYFEC